METPSATCNFCGKHLVMGEILYTTDARVACAPCNAKVEVVTTDMKVGHNIRNAAIFSLCAAAMGVFLMFVPSFMFKVLGITSTVSAIIAAIFSLRAANRKGDERFTQYVQQDKGAIYACSIIGLVFSAVATVLIIGTVISTMGAKQRQVDDYQYR